ncbi:MAG: Gfo/Idh/MocA family protein [Pseudomonadales bacterium]
MNNLRLGIIGAGEIAHFSAASIARATGVTLTAVADVNSARANDLARRRGAQFVYEDAQALLQADTTDAVYIAVPNCFHAEVANAALAAGKHVLLDKPFALNLAEATSVASCARTHQRVLMLGMNTRFDARVQRARSIVASNNLGPVYHAKASWRRRAGIPRIGSWFTSKDSAGGGALLDIGVHMLDAALYVLDNFEPRSVSGIVENRFGRRALGEGQWGRSERTAAPFDVDDHALALIRMANGQSLTLETSWALHQPKADLQELELYGEDAGAAVFEDSLYYNGNAGAYQIQQGMGGTPDFAHGCRVQNFVNTIAGTEEPMVTVDQALAVQKIIDAIYQSAASGTEVKL